jgi:hypothetical protein
MQGKPFIAHRYPSLHWPFATHEWTHLQNSLNKTNVAQELQHDYEATSAKLLLPFRSQIKRSEQNLVIS